MGKMSQLVFESLGLSICELKYKIEKCNNPRHVLKYVKAINILHKCMGNMSGGEK